MPKIISPAERPRTATDFRNRGPRAAIVQISSTYDWLYRPMMLRLRKRFGTRFLILTSGDIGQQRYGDMLAAGDRLVDLDAIDRDPTAAGNPEAVYAEAQRLEREYGMIYMRDILQQDREYAVRFLSNAPFFALRPGGLPDLAVLTARINAYYAVFERLFDEHDVDLVFARPDSLYGAPLIQVALRNGVPTTFPDVAKYKGLLTWAYGAYRGHELVRTRYDAAGPDMGADIPDAQSIRYADRDFKRVESVANLAALLREAAMMLVIRAIMLAQDVRQWRFGRRTRASTEFRRLMNVYRTGRWLDRRSVGDPSELARQPYVLFLLPVEPEFNTHTLAREFANSHAIVQQLSLCLPAGYRLVVKEHGSNIGNRRLDFYEHLAKLPNLVFADYRMPGTAVAERAAAIATMAGTIGMEAALMGKQVIVFSTRTIYGFLPHVHVVTSMHDLPAAIHASVAERSESEITDLKAAGRRFYAAMQQLGFDGDGSPLFKGTRSELPEDTLDRAFDLLIDNLAVQCNRAAAPAAPNQSDAAE